MSRPTEGDTITVWKEHGPRRAKVTAVFDRGLIQYVPGQRGTSCGHVWVFDEGVDWLPGFSQETRDALVAGRALGKSAA